MHTRDCNSITGTSTPSIGEAGKTGDWRLVTPVIDRSKCIPSKRNRPSCFLCWLYCPEAAIKRCIPPEIDLDYCKGCGICAEVCPSGAIALIGKNDVDETGPKGDNL